jgi:chorismate mutase
VQRGLHARWRANTASRPTTRPDLATEVRPRLDALTPRILRLLRQTEPLRRVPIACRTAVGLVRKDSEPRTRLDGLHQGALTRALAPVCEATT